MNNTVDFSALGQVFPSAQSVICFIHPQATYDAVAAALSMCLAIRQTGKSCEVLCEEPMRVEYNYLVGIDKVQQSVGNRDLVIAFDYHEEQVDKVSYNINEETQRFELIISPKSGAQPLDPNTVNFSRSGLSADLIFLFGYHSMDEMGEVYKKEKYTLDQAYSVAFTQNKVNPFARMHLALRPENFSYSEMVFFVIRQLQMGEVKDDLATNLLSGMEYATERFMQANLPARVFESVAFLIRSGGRRQADNPAFQQLNTPIRQAPMSGRGVPAPAPMGQFPPQISQVQPGFQPGQQPVMAMPPVSAPMTSPIQFPTQAQVQPMQTETASTTDQAESVSSEDFVRAMQGGQKE
jgi:hypothetical protein